MHGQEDGGQVQLGSASPQAGGGGDVDLEAAAQDGGGVEGELSKSIADVLLLQEAVVHVEPVVRRVLSPGREDGVEGREDVQWIRLPAQCQCLGGVEAGAALDVGGVAAEAPVGVARWLTHPIIAAGLRYPVQVDITEAGVIGRAEVWGSKTSTA